MSTYNYQAGLGNVGSYQVSGVPYVTGSVASSAAAKQIVFPSVTSWVIVSNVGGSADVKVGFSQKGIEGTSGNNYFMVNQDQVTPRLELKVTELWVSGANEVSIMAGLTGISVVNINTENVSPSGSNWSGSLQALVG